MNTNIEDQAISAMQVIALAALGAAPGGGVGIIVGGVALEIAFSVIFGEDTEDKPVWEQVKDKVKYEIRQSEIASTERQLRQLLNGSKTPIKDLQTYQKTIATMSAEGKPQEEIDKAITELCSRIASIEDSLELQRGYFMPSENDQAFVTLPFFMEWASIHLMLQKLQVEWAEKASSPFASDYKSEYEKRFAEYVKYVLQKKDCILRWRRGRINHQHKKESRRLEKYSPSKSGIGSGQYYYETSYWVKYKDLENPHDEYNSSGNRNSSDYEKAKTAAGKAIREVEETIENTVEPFLKVWREKKPEMFADSARKGGAKLRLSVDSLKCECTRDEHGDTAEVENLKLEALFEDTHKTGHPVYKLKSRWNVDKGDSRTEKVNWKIDLDLDGPDYKLWFNASIEEQDPFYNPNDTGDSDSPELFFHDMVHMAKCGGKKYAKKFRVSAGNDVEMEITFDLKTEIV